MRTRHTKLLITLGLVLIFTLSLATTPAHAVVNKFKDDVGIGTTNPGASLEVVGDIISAGTEWTAHATTSGTWRSVAYGNGMFVATAGSGSVMSSPDGINWTDRTQIDTSAWMSVTYGNGMFVAVSDSADTYWVMTSPDGINWTGRTASSATLWKSVTYGNGLFVAVARNDGSTASVMTSPDGINWTGRTAPAARQWYSVTYGNGLFVAVAYGAGTVTDAVMTSSDGITWADQDSASAQNWYNVTYGNGLFVAVSESSSNPSVMTSSDGATWTGRSVPEPSNGWKAVTYGDGLFVAVSEVGTHRVMTSPDGINWTPRTAGEANDWFGVAYGNGVFVAVSYSGTNRAMSSGKAKFNEIPHKNIYQGGMSIYGNVGVGTTIPSSAMLYVAGACGGNTSCNEDLAEIFPKPADEMFEPGDVVVLSGTDKFNLRKSQEPYDTRVAGIYSTDPGMMMGGDGRVGLTTDQQDASQFSEIEIPLALAGKVPVKVTNENGAIKKGDLLTTSSTPGHAMKCPMETEEDKVKAMGAILGKAMEPFDGEEGKIDALVTLQ